MNEIIVKQRIKDILFIKSSNPTKLAKEYSVNQKTLNNQINSDVQLSASTILLILNTFPDVSAEWLMRGVGEMLKPTINETKISPINVDGELTNTEMEKEIKRLRASIDALIEKNERLEAELAKYREKERIDI